MLGLASCQTEPEGLNVNVGGEVDTVVTVTIPETETRAGGNDSAKSVFDNGILEDENTTMRYILEIYYGDVRAERQVKYSDRIETITFPVRLVAGRDYNFVVWADVVTKNAGEEFSDSDNHYNTTTENKWLTNVTLKGTWDAMDESRDAFTGYYNTEKEGKKYTGNLPINITLTRPFAKLRVITTDMVELGNLNITPVSAKVTYSAFSHESFNALDGTYSGEISSKTHTYAIADYADFANTAKEDSHKVLFTDYFFADASDVVKFELDVYEGDVDNQNATTLIKHNDFKTDIPAQRNYLTTIQGNILTDGNDITVTVENDGKFENAGDASDDAPYYKETISSAAEFLAALDKAGEFIVISNITIDGSLINAGSTVNNGQASTFATRAGGKTTIVDLNGLTITVDNQTGDALVSLDATDSLIFAGEGTIEGTGKLVKGGTVVVTGAATVDKDVAEVKSGLDALVYICENGGEFTFADNLEANSPLAVTTTKSVVINGNGETITYTGSDRAFNVNGLETANVTINDLTFVNSASYSERCISFNVAGKLTLNNVTVGETGTPATYAINLPGSSDGAEVVINNSKIRGNIALNIWGEKAVVNATNTIFSNYDSTEVEDYTTIVLNNDGSTVAEGAVVNIIGGKVIGKNEKDQPLYAVNNGTVTGVVNISETTEVIGGIKETVAIVDYNSTSFYSYTTIQGAIDKVCKDKKGFVRLVKDIAVDESITIPADGNVTIDLNGKTITGTDKGTVSYGLIVNKGTLTVKNGKITLKAEQNRGWSAYSSVISNSCGTLTIEEGAHIEHLGGTDMAYGIDNLSSDASAGVDGSVKTTINGGHIKSTYRAIRQFLNSYVYNNELVVNGGVIEGANKSIWMQDPNAKSNLGKLEVNAGATLKGDVYLFVTAGSTEWPVEVSIAASAVNGKVLTGNVPEGYAVELINGVWVVNAYTTVESIDNLDKLLLAGEAVEMGCDITASAKVTTANSGYGATGVKVANGAVLDGNDKTLTINDAWGTWDCVVAATNGTIKNLTVNGAMRGIFMPGADGDVVIDNVVFNNVIYTFNSDAGNKNYGVYISNSTLNGWTSFSNVHKEVVFTNCSFGKGNGYAFCRPYNPCVFEDCEFSTDMEFDTTQQANIVFKNCTYGGVKITAENAASLKTGDVTFFYNGVGSVSFE